MARAFGRLSSQFYKLLIFGHRPQISHSTATYRLTRFKSTLASPRQQEEPDLPPESDDKTNRSITNRVLDEHGHPYVDLSFNNAEEAYRSKSNFEIIRSLLVFNLCSVKFLVDNNKEVPTFFPFFSFFFLDFLGKKCLRFFNYIYFYHFSQFFIF